MLYIFEEEDLLSFVEEIQCDALDAYGNYLDCSYDSKTQILTEAKSWATISK